jgi:SsrA-binding protein
MARDGATKTIALNRRARHDFELLETFEAGLALTGTEVKALRAGRGDIKRAFAQLRDGEAFLVGAHIGEYAQGNIHNHEPERDRKLLLHRRELDSLLGKVQERNLTIVPTRLYFKNGRVKVELAVARGKDVRDKRRDIADREIKRQLERAVKGGWREE